MEAFSCLDVVDEDEARLEAQVDLIEIVSQEKDLSKLAPTADADDVAVSAPHLAQLEQANAGISEGHATVAPVHCEGSKRSVLHLDAVGITLSTEGCSSKHCFDLFADGPLLESFCRDEGKASDLGS